MGSKEDGVGNVISAGGTDRVCRSRAAGHSPQANNAKDMQSTKMPKANLSLRIPKLYA
jgi:hypothetical protein